MDLLHGSDVHQTGQKGYDVCVHELLLYLFVSVVLYCFRKKRCSAILFHALRTSYILMKDSMMLIDDITAVYGFIHISSTRTYEDFAGDGDVYGQIKSDDMLLIHDMQQRNQIRRYHVQLVLTS